MYHGKYLKNETEDLDEKHTSQLCEESFPFEIRKFKEDKEDEIIDKIMKSEGVLETPYYRLLAEALQEHGTAGKVSKATGIPKSSVQEGIKKIRKFLQ